MVLAVSAVSAERGTVADSVLSRGISRHQYFLAKWHARLVVVVATFTVLAAAVLVAGYFLFRDDAESDLTLVGGLAAVLAVSAILAVIVSWGVVIGALTNGTVLGITVFWLLLYGAGFLLTLLPEPWPSPDRELGRLKFVLRGQFNEVMLGNLVLGSVVLCAAAAIVGLVGFSSATFEITGPFDAIRPALAAAAVPSGDAQEPGWSYPRLATAQPVPAPPAPSDGLSAPPRPARLRRGRVPRRGAARDRTRTAALGIGQRRRLPALHPRCGEGVARVQNSVWLKPTGQAP